MKKESSVITLSHNQIEYIEEQNLCSKGKSTYEHNISNNMSVFAYDSGCIHIIQDFDN